MNDKLDCILLIDDDESTNFLNKMVLEQCNCTNKIVALESGIDALEFLRINENGHNPKPDLIFLDINMPKMNGWEFLEEYDKLDEECKGGVVVVMLTTSLNPDDANKAEDIGLISGFMNKPLTMDMVHRLIKENFG